MLTKTVGSMCAVMLASAAPVFAQGNAGQAQGIYVDSQSSAASEANAGQRAGNRTGSVAKMKVAPKQVGRVAKKKAAPVSLPK